MQYLIWVTNADGSLSLNYWDKVEQKYNRVEGVDFTTGAMYLLYYGDPNYAALYNGGADGEIVITNTGAGGGNSSTGNSNPFPGLGFVNKLVDTPKKKKAWLYVAVIGGAVVLGYFLYKKFK